MTGVSGDVQSISDRALNGPYDALALALDRWLDSARTAYAAGEFAAVQADLEVARTLYGELTTRTTVGDFGPWARAVARSHGSSAHKAV